MHRRITNYAAAHKFPNFCRIKKNTSNAFVKIQCTEALFEPLAAAAII